MKTFNKTMKIKLFLLILLLVSIPSKGQFVMGSKYQAQTFEEFTQPLQTYANAFDKAKTSINNLKHYITIILSHNIDTQLRGSLTNCFNELQLLSQNLYSSGLTKETNKKYETILSKVQSEIVQYNNRIHIDEEKSNVSSSGTNRQDNTKESQIKIWRGTAFAIKNNLVVTNYHTVENAKTITLKGVEGSFSKSYKAEIVASDRVNDLAILAITEPDFIGFQSLPYSVRTTGVEVGEEVYVLGFPMTATMGEEIKYSAGAISSKTGFMSDVSMFQISAPVQPGNSGGPLFDKNGSIIGVVCAKHNEAENVGYAIKASCLWNLADSYKSTSILPSTDKAITQLARTEQIKIVKDYIFILECEEEKESNSNVNKSTSKGKNETCDFSKYIPSELIQKISNPFIRFNYSHSLTRILSIERREQETVLIMEHSANNRYGFQSFPSCYIEKETFIRYKENKYQLSFVDNISTTHQEEFFEESKIFKLVFPVKIEENDSFDLIEPGRSSWKFFGVSTNPMIAEEYPTIMSEKEMEDRKDQILRERIGNFYEVKGMDISLTVVLSKNAVFMLQDPYNTMASLFIKYFNYTSSNSILSGTNFTYNKDCDIHAVLTIYKIADDDGEVYGYIEIFKGNDTKPFCAQEFNGEGSDIVSLSEAILQSIERACKKIVRQAKDRPLPIAISNTTVTTRKKK